MWLKSYSSCKLEGHTALSLYLLKGGTRTLSLLSPLHYVENVDTYFKTGSFKLIPACYF